MLFITQDMPLYAVYNITQKRFTTEHARSLNKAVHLLDYYKRNWPNQQYQLRCL